MYDVAVIGSGPGGYVAALRAAMRGAKTCCIEKDKLGGACLNVGCIPTKAMLYASGAYWRLHHLDKLGISVSEPQIDAGVFLNRSAAVVKGLRDGVAFLLKKRNVDVITGRARLAGNKKILVETSNGTDEIEARNIIVATGSRPIRSDFLPWDSGCLMTTDQATTRFSSSMSTSRSNSMSPRPLARTSGSTSTPCRFMLGPISTPMQ